MIGIGGTARSGKDTLAKCLSKIVEEDLGLKPKRFSFASKLKEELDEFLIKNYGISAFSDDDEEKKIIRPLLVSHGEQMKRRYGRDIWVKTLFKDIDVKQSFPILTDVRFDFEAESVQEFGGVVIHINKLGNNPSNEVEYDNDPLVMEKADICHSWPPYSEKELIQCDYHAQILWQMAKESNLDKWMQIYH